MDSNGQPANEDLIKKVKNYIDPDNGLGGGKAPIGALVTVDAPEVIEINIAVSLTFENGYSWNDVKDALIANLKKYLTTFEINTGERELDRITVTRIGHVILSTEGIKDYSNLLVNDAEYVEIPIGTVPMLGEVSVT